jgi:hypothetical protein
VMLISNLIFEDGDNYWMYAFPSFRTAMCTLIIVRKLALLNRRIMVSGPGWLAKSRERTVLLAERTMPRIFVQPSIVRPTLLICH